jgi:hypothetical protein
MTIVFLPVMMFAIALCLVFNPRRPGRVGGDEEFVHAAALGRRDLLHEPEGAERRRESRYEVDQECTASVLGNEDSRTACRIINVSRSGMRIAVSGSFPPDSQINVEWGKEFFVGTIRYLQVKGEQQILGLRVVSTNCR